MPGALGDPSHDEPPAASVFIIPGHGVKNGDERPGSPQSGGYLPKEVSLPLKKGRFSLTPATLGPDLERYGDRSGPAARRLAYRPDAMRVVRTNELRSQAQGDRQGGPDSRRSPCDNPLTTSLPGHCVRCRTGAQAFMPKTVRLK